ncbi:mucin-12-like [Stomoxys calcitrans]|uniref:mucin-12-like n=1 Tax=Stomoxys calcitrans TaxID=35570 RepID=UPI0027E33234|nr:mucin-12-like [Stomoxys calcitrans]
MHKLFIVISLLIALTTALTIYGKPYIRIRQGANPNELIISVRHPCTNQTRTTTIAIPKKEEDFHKETPEDYSNFSITPEIISKGQSFTTEKNTIQLNYEATRQQHSNATPANKTIFNYETTTLLYSIYLNENTVSKNLDQPYNTATKVQTQTSNRNKGDDDGTNTPDVATIDTSKDRNYSSESETTLQDPEDERLITSEVTIETVTSNQESTIRPPSTSLKVEEDAIHSIAGLTVITSDPKEDTSVYPVKGTTLLPATLEVDSTLDHKPYNIDNEVQTQTSNRFKGDDDVSDTPVTDPDVATKDTSKDRYYSSENETTLTSADARLITSEVNNEAATSNQESSIGPPSTNLRVEKDAINSIAGLTVITSDPSEDTSAYPATLLPAALEVDSTLDHKPYNIANKVQTQTSHRNKGHDDMNTPAKGPHLGRSDTNQDRSYSSEYETTLQLLTTDGASPITSEVNIEASTSNQYSTKGLSTNLKVVEDTDNSIAVLTVMTVNPSVYTSDYSVKGTTLLPATLEVDSTPNTEPSNNNATSNQDSIKKPPNTTSKEEEKILKYDVEEYTDITTASLDVVTIDSSEDASDSFESELKPTITTQVADSTTTNAPSDIATWYQDLTMEQSTSSEEKTPNSDTQLHIDNKTGGLEVVTIVSSEDGRNSSKNEITLQPKPPSEMKEDSIKVPTGTISEAEKVTYISALQKDMDFTTADDTSGGTRDSPENASTIQPTTSVDERPRTTEVIDDVATLKQDPTKVRLSKTLKVQQKTLILHKQVDMDNTSVGLDILTGDFTEDKNDSSDTESTLQPTTSEAVIPTTFGANNDATTSNDNSNIESRGTKLEIEAVTPNPDSQEDTNNTTVGSDAVETDRSEYTSNYTDNENTMLPTSEDALPTGTYAPIPNDTLNQDSTVVPPSMTLEVDKWPLSADTLGDKDNPTADTDVVTYDPSKHTRDSPAQQRTTPEENSSTNTDETHNATTSNQDQTMEPPITISKVEVATFTLNMQEGMGTTSSSREEVIRDPSKNKSFSSENETTLHPTKPEGESSTYINTPDDIATLKQDSTLLRLPTTLEKEEELFSSATGSLYKITGDVSEDVSHSLDSQTTLQPLTEEGASPTNTDETNDEVSPNQESTKPAASTKSEVEEETLSLDTQENMDNTTAAQDKVINDSSEGARYVSANEITPGPSTLGEADITSTYKHVDTGTLNQDSTMEPLTMRFEIEAKTFSFDTQQEMNNANGVLNIMTESPTNTDMPDDAASSNQVSTMVPISTKSKVEEEIPSSDTQENMNNTIEAQDEVTNDPSEKTSNSSEDKITLQSITAEGSSPTSTYAPDNTATLNRDSTMGPLTMTFEVEATRLYLDTQEELNNANRVLNIMAESSTNTDTSDLAASLSQDSRIVLSSTTATQSKAEEETPSSDAQENMNNRTEAQDEVTNDSSKKTSNSSEYDITLQSITSEVEGATSTNALDDTVTLNQDSTMGPLTMMSEGEAKTLFSDTQEEVNNANGVLHLMTGRHTNTHTPDDAASPSQDSTMVLFSTTATQSKVEEDTPSLDTHENTNNTTAAPDEVTNNPNEETRYSSANKTTLQPIISEDADLTSTTVTLNQDSTMVSLTMMFEGEAKTIFSDTLDAPNQDSTIVLPSTKPKVEEESPGSDTQEDTENTTESQEEITNDSIEETRYSSANEVTIQPMTLEDADATSTNVPDDSVTLNQDSTMVPPATTFEVEATRHSLDTQEDIDNATGSHDIHTGDPSEETNNSPKNKTIKLPPRSSEGASSTTTVVSDDDFTTNQDSTIAPASTTSEEETFSPHTLEDKDNATGSVVFTSDSEDNISDYTENKTISQPTAPEIPKSNTTDASYNTATSNQDSTMVSPSRTSDREEKTLGSEAKKDTDNSARSPNIVKSDFNEDTNDSLKYRTTLQLIKSAGESGMATDPSDDTVISNYDSTMEPPSTILQIEESTPSPKAQGETYIAAARWLYTATYDPSKGTIDSPENESPLQSITTEDTRPGDTADVTDDTANSYQDSTMMATITISPGTRQSMHNAISGLEVVNSDHREDISDSPQQPRTAEDESLSTTDAIDGASAQNEDSAMVLSITISEVKERKLSTDAQEEYMVNTTASLDVVTSEASEETSDSSVNETTLQPDSTAIDDAASSKSNAEEKLRVSSDKKKEIANITTIVHYAEDEATLQLRTAGDANSNTTDAINYFIILNPDSTIIAPSTISEVKEGPFSRDVQEEIDKDTYFDVVTDKLSEDSINSSVNRTIEAIDDAASSKKDLKMVPPVTTSEIDEETLSSHVQEDTDSTTQGRNAVTSDSSEATTVSPENEATLQSRTLESSSYTTIDVPDITATSNQDSPVMLPSSKSNTEEETPIATSEVEKEALSPHVQKDAYSTTQGQDAVTRDSSETKTLSPANEATLQPIILEISRSTTTNVHDYATNSNSNQDSLKVLSTTKSNSEEKTLSSDIEEDIDNVTAVLVVVISDPRQDTSDSTEDETTLKPRTTGDANVNTTGAMIYITTSTQNSTMMAPSTILEVEEVTFGSNKQEDMGKDTDFDIVTDELSEDTSNSSVNGTTLQPIRVEGGTIIEAINDAASTKKELKMVPSITTSEIDEETLSSHVQEDTDSTTQGQDGVTSDSSEATTVSPENEATLQPKTLKSPSSTTIDVPYITSNSTQDSTEMIPSTKSYAEEETFSSDKKKEVTNGTAVLILVTSVTRENTSDSTEYEATLQLRTAGDANSNTTDAINYTIISNQDSTIKASSTTSEEEKVTFSPDAQKDIYKDTYFDVVTDELSEDTSNSSVNGTTLQPIRVEGGTTIEAINDAASSKKELKMMLLVTTSEISSHVQEDTDSTTQSPDAVTSDSSEATTVSYNEATMQPRTLESPSFPPIDVTDITANSNQDSPEMIASTKSNAEEETFGSDKKKEIANVTAVLVVVTSVTRENTSDSTEDEATLQPRTAGYANVNTTDAINYLIILNQGPTIMAPNTTLELEEVTLSRDVQEDAKYDIDFDVVTNGPNEYKSDSSVNETKLQPITLGDKNIEAIGNAVSSKEELTMVPAFATLEVEEETLSFNPQEDTNRTTQYPDEVAGDSSEVTTGFLENEATLQPRTLEASSSITAGFPVDTATLNHYSTIIAPSTTSEVEEESHLVEVTIDPSEDPYDSAENGITLQPRTAEDENPSTTDVIDNATISNQDTRMMLTSGTTEVEENILSVEVKKDTDSTTADLDVVTSDPSEGTNEYPENKTTLQVRTTEGESPTINDEPDDATTSKQDSTIVPPSMTTVAEEETVSSNEHFDTDKTTVDVGASSLDPSENESDSAENETTVQPITSEGVIPALTIELDDSVNLSHESSMVPTTTKTKIEEETLRTDSKGDRDGKTSGLVVVSTDHGKDISPSSGKETTLLHITKEVASSITTEVHADTTASNQHLEVKPASSSLKVEEEYLSAVAQHNTNSTTLNPYTVMRNGSEDTIASPEKGTTLQATKLESINRGNTDPSYTSREEESTLSPGVQEDTGGVISGTTLQATKLESIDRGNTDPSYTSRVEENTLSPDVQQDTGGVTTGPINPSKNSSYSPEVETIIQFTIFAIASNVPVDTANSSQDSAMVIRSSTLEESTFSANTEVDIDKQTARVAVTTSDPRENTNDSPENKTSVKSTTSEEVNGIPNDAADDDDATANQNSTMLPQSAISELDEDKVTQENTENAIGSLEAVTSNFSEHETTLKLTTSDGIDSTTNDVLDDAVTANQYPTKMPPSAISEEDSLRSDAQKYTNSTTADPDVFTRDPSEDTSDSPEKETTLQPMAPENASPTTTEATDNTATSYQDCTRDDTTDLFTNETTLEPMTAGYANPITRDAIDDTATSNEHSNISSPFTTSEIAEKKVSSKAQEDTHNATADIEPIKLESATTVEAFVNADTSSEKLIRELPSTTLELEEKTYTPEAQDTDSTTADLDIVTFEVNPTTTKLTNDAETLNQDSTMRLSTILGEEEETLITAIQMNIDNTTAELDVTISDTSDHTSVSFENEATLLPTTLEGASLTTTDSSNDNTTLNQVSIIVQPSITSEPMKIPLQDSTMKAPSTTSTVEEGKLSPEIDWDMENTTVIIEERTDSSETEATPQPTTPEDASSIIIDASDDDATSNDDSTMKPPRYYSTETAPGCGNVRSWSHPPLGIHPYSGRLQESCYMCFNAIEFVMGKQQNATTDIICLNITANKSNTFFKDVVILLQQPTAT